MRITKALTHTFVFLVLCTSFLSCEGIIDIQEDSLRFQKGVLDLSKFEFKEESVVELKGDWEFYHNDFHYPPFHGKKNLTGYLDVPNSWQGQE